MDCGATDFVSNNASHFIYLQDCEIPLVLGDTRKITVEKRGTISINHILFPALLVPSFSLCLMSQSTMAQLGWKGAWEGNYMLMKCGMATLRTTIYGKLYWLDAPLLLGKQGQPKRNHAAFLTAKPQYQGKIEEALESMMKRVHIQTRGQTAKGAPKPKDLTGPNAAKIGRAHV